MAKPKVPRWILKTEPEAFGWPDQVKEGVAMWDGVRNHQAKAHLARMKCGELAYFYHSGKTRQLIGIVEITREAYPDPTDASGRWLAVDVSTFARLVKPIELKFLKSMTELENSALARQSRLSVVPLTDEEAKALFKHIDLQRV